jgi:hypothetical protein
MSNAIDHERKDQVEKASLINMPDDINPLIALFEQRKRIAEKMLENSSNEYIFEMLSLLFDHANNEIKEYLAL